MARTGPTFLPARTALMAFLLEAYYKEQEAFCPREPQPAAFGERTAGSPWSSEEAPVLESRTAEGQRLEDAAVGGGDDGRGCGSNNCSWLTLQNLEAAASAQDRLRSSWFPTIILLYSFCCSSLNVSFTFSLFNPPSLKRQRLI